MISNHERIEQSGVPLYQLKMTLKGSQPPIWRRVVVRADMTLDCLHEVIQTAMGWTNDHMHQFIVGSGTARTFYGMTDPEFGSTDGVTLDEQRYTVANLVLAAKRKFIYEYDFGDGWRHDVVVEKLLPPDATFKHPVCLAGANACPPEDCGGIHWFHNLVVIMADPKHPGHEGMKEWIGGGFDPAKFSPEDVNLVLKKFQA